VAFARAFEKAAEGEALRRTSPMGVVRTSGPRATVGESIEDRGDEFMLDADYRQQEDVDLLRASVGGGWKIPLFVTGFLVVCVGTMLAVGWRPPLSLRQSKAWHALHLPMAAPPPAHTGSPPPAPPPTLPAPAEAVPVVAPPPVAAAPREADPPSVPSAPPAVAPAPVEAPSVAKAPPAAEAPSKGRDEKAEKRPLRPRPKGPAPLRGYVWSEREQRLVPVTPAVPPTPSPPPQ
jgi:hypothetical protein